MYLVCRIVQQEFVKQQNTKLLGLSFTHWKDAVAAIRHSKAADDLFHLHLKQRTFGTYMETVHIPANSQACFKTLYHGKQQNLLQSKSRIYIMDTVEQ